MIGSDTICRNRWADNNMKCELKVLREPPIGWFSIDSWKTFVVRVFELEIMFFIAVPIANFCIVRPINILYVGCILGILLYLLAWCSCKKRRA